MSMSYKWPAVKFVEKENPWVSYFKKQIFERNNCINAVALGSPGSGKSYLTLSLCHMFDPDFELEGNVYFKAGHMFKDIKDWVYKGTKPGKIWVLDEAGISANSMNWQDEINKGLNAFFQTARHRNYFFFATVPYLNFLSKGVRTMMGCEFKADGYNKKNQTIVHPKVIQYNPEIDKIYKKRLLVLKDRDSILCNKILIPKPPVKIIREYEKMKQEFTADLFGNINSAIEAYEHKKRVKADPSCLTTKQEKIVDMIKEGKTVQQMQESMGLHHITGVYVYMQALKKKGFNIKAKRDGDIVTGYTIE